ncbi:MAG: COX15/CtaA family protein [Deltaproteobacteria bacterium]|nr:COX15/CtaA family protein [Deltaproteobacteria bacterium]
MDENQTRTHASDTGPRASVDHASGAHSGFDRRSVHRPIERWLIVIAGLIALMVLVGGMTRLTGSGLSITEWRPVSGILPPLTESDWNDLFQKYQSSPQFQKENQHFELQAFKSIFWWEWAHRFLGRMVGFFVLFPLVLFWRRRSIEPWMRRRVIALLAFGALQGGIGWLMVASGLVDIPRVSHYRLALHLMMAYALLTFTVWTVLEVRYGRRSYGAAEPRFSTQLADANTQSSHTIHGRPQRVTGRSRFTLVHGLCVFLALLIAQLTYGAFVAGLRAGYLFPTFPKMGVEWLPLASMPTCAESAATGRACDPTLALWTADAVLVQFVHRWLGAAIALLGVALAFLGATRARSPRSVWIAFGAAVFGQFVLGIATMLRFYTAPVAYGAAHQAGATLLLVATTIALFHARRARAYDSAHATGTATGTAPDAALLDKAIAPVGNRALATRGRVA